MMDSSTAKVQTCSIPGGLVLSSSCGGPPPPAPRQVSPNPGLAPPILGGSSSPPGFSGHYYEGSVWSSEDNDPAEFSGVSVVIQVPQSNPASTNDFYYVIDSIWDSASSYDQIGFDAYNGVWGVVWSVDPNCNGVYHYLNDAYTLTPNTLYKFVMALDGQGSVDFTVYKDTFGSLNQVYSDSYYTGGMWFEGGSSWGCSNGNTYADYTNYEEVYDTQAQSWPDFNFLFSQNSQVLQSCAINGCPGSWSSWSSGSPPSGDPTENFVSGNSTNIENEWFNDTVTHPPGLWNLGVEMTPGENTSGSFSGQVDFVCTNSCPSDSISLTMSSLPSGWSYSYNVSSGKPDLYWEVEITIPAGANPGNYTLTGEAKDTTSGILTFVQFILRPFNPPSGGGGGGGCVAFGTLISTPTGSHLIQSLRVGETVVGFNLSSGKLVNLTLTGLNSTISRPLVSINNGSLILTATDQPVYVWNLTFEGWVLNPENLTAGDYLFSPLNGTWTPIYSVQVLHHPTRVYDVVTSGVNDFIANGFLLDKKTPPPD